MDHAALHALIGRIYGAPGDEAAWRALLGDFTGSFGAEHSHFVVFDGPGRVHFDYISLMAAGQIYADHYAALDTAVHRLLARPDRLAATQQDMMSAEELRACPVQQEMMPSFGVEHRLWVKSGLGEGLTLTSAVIRSAGQGAFEPDSYRLLEILHVHIERALHLHFELGRARAATAAREAGLEALATGLVLTDAAGRLLFANRAARALLLAGDGLRLARGGLLAAANPAADARLQAILARAIGRSGPALAGSMAIARRAARPLVLRVLPGPPALRQTESRAASVILIHDPDREVAVVGEALTALGLTEAEARLVASLVAGNSLADYARLAGRRPHTVRSTLKSAFAKTGTHRQSELVALALRAASLP